MNRIITIVIIGFIAILTASCGFSPLVENNPAVDTPSPQPAVVEPPASTPTLEALPSGIGGAGSPPIITADNVMNLVETGRTTLENPTQLLWFLDGSKAAVLSPDKLDILNTVTLLSEGSIQFAPSIFSLAFSPGETMIASTSDQITLDLRQVADGSLIRTITPPGQFLAFDFSPDGKYLLTGSLDEIAATLWNVSNGQEVKKLMGFETAAPVYTVAFSPDNRSLVWISRATIQLMDLETGKLGDRFEHEDFITAYTLSKDGKMLATAAGGTVNGEFVPLIKIWDIPTGQQIGLIQVDKMPFGNALDFSPDGQLLAAGMGPMVFLWGVPSGEQLAELQAGGEGISSLSFSPDGSAIGTTSSDGAVILWRVNP